MKVSNMFYTKKGVEVMNLSKIIYKLSFSLFVLTAVAVFVPLGTQVVYCQHQQPTG